MSLINPMAATTAVQSNPSQVVNRETRNQNLRPDQVIQATVEEGGLERVLINLHGRRQWVETEIPLATGQKLSIHLVESDKGPVLQLQPVQLDAYIRRMIHLVGQSFPLAPFAAKLAQLPQESSMPPFLARLLAPLLESRPPDAAWFANLANLLGLNFEHRLSENHGQTVAENLKSWLLRTGQTNPGAAAPGIATILQHLEAHQLFQARLALDNFFYLPLPLAEGDYGFLLIENGGQNKGPEDTPDRGTMIRLCLNLSALGPVTAILHASTAGLSLRLEFGNSRSLAHVRQHQAEIEETMTSWGLRMLNLVEGTEPPERQLLNRLTARNEGVVDARI
ncbi:MAG: hypothetical protein D6751_08935 [Deltaproteobacteria bacterium]|nr:MAG: hypothetical protein D6751_08935 [Deltaproteobacteria bacterium]